MRYALNENGLKIEAIKNQNGICPLCGSIMISKCGEINIHHWSHKSVSSCESNCKEMSIWHKNWQDCFKEEDREIIILNNNRRKIADAFLKYNDKKYIFEFQHSQISTSEIEIREKHFNTLIWIFDNKSFNNSKIINFCTRPVLLDDGINLSLLTFKAPIILPKLKFIKTLQENPTDLIKYIIKYSKEKKSFTDFFDELPKNTKF